MSLSHRNLIQIPKKSHLLNPTNPKFLKTPNLSHPHFIKLAFATSNGSSISTSFKVQKWNSRAIGYEGLKTRDGSEDSGFDNFLSVLELLSLGTSATSAAGFAASYAVLGPQRALEKWVGSKFLAWQVVVLVGGIVIGAWIRRRQWRRVCREEDERVRVSGGSGLGLLGRVEKLEEDVRSSVTILRVLSRQVEKLGIRFRVTRKSLKEPIAETAALAQKNSEATRALAVQEGVLEKELGEVQKVLMAMQEQQQKQLELILAIAKSGNLLDRKPIQDAKDTKKLPKETARPKPEPVYAMDSQKETQ